MAHSRIYYLFSCHRDVMVNGGRWVVDGGRMGRDHSSFLCGIFYVHVMLWEKIEFSLMEFNRNLRSGGITT